MTEWLFKFKLITQLSFIYSGRFTF